MTVLQQGCCCCGFVVNGSLFHPHPASSKAVLPSVRLPVGLACPPSSHLLVCFSLPGSLSAVSVAPPQLARSLASCPRISSRAGATKAASASTASLQFVLSSGNCQSVLSRVAQFASSSGIGGHNRYTLSPYTRTHARRKNTQVHTP